MNRNAILSSNPRVWDLAPGDTFRGRTIVAIHGRVGLASSPVAVISFTADDECPARFPAAHSDALQHRDEVMLRARSWIRCHGLQEGDPVDLHSLRSEVMTSLLV